MLKVNLIYVSKDLKSAKMQPVIAYIMNLHAMFVKHGCEVCIYKASSFTRKREWDFARTDECEILYTNMAPTKLMELAKDPSAITITVYYDHKMPCTLNERVVERESPILIDCCLNHSLVLIHSNQNSKETLSMLPDLSTDTNHNFLATYKNEEFPYLLDDEITFEYVMDEWFDCFPSSKVDPSEHWEAVDDPIDIARYKNASRELSFEQAEKHGLIQVKDHKTTYGNYSIAYVGTVIEDSLNAYHSANPRKGEYFNLLDDRAEEILAGCGTVLDAGSFIGTFAIRTALQFDCLVHAYEPYPPSFSFLIENIRRNSLEDNVIPHNQAVVNNGQVTANLYLDCQINNSLVQKKRRKYVEVATTNINDVIAEHGASVVKLDIEGYEYAIIPTMNLEPIQLMFIECHMDLSEIEFEKFVDYLKRHFSHVRHFGYRMITTHLIAYH